MITFFCLPKWYSVLDRTLLIKQAYELVGMHTALLYYVMYTVHEEETFLQPKQQLTSDITLPFVLKGLIAQLSRILKFGTVTYEPLERPSL